MGTSPELSHPPQYTRAAPFVLSLAAPQPGDRVQSRCGYGFAACPDSPRQFPRRQIFKRFYDPRAGDDAHGGEEVSKLISEVCEEAQIRIALERDRGAVGGSGCPPRFGDLDIALIAGAARRRLGRSLPAPGPKSQFVQSRRRGLTIPRLLKDPSVCDRAYPAARRVRTDFSQERSAHDSYNPNCFTLTNSDSNSHFWQCPKHRTSSV